MNTLMGATSVVNPVNSFNSALPLTITLNSSDGTRGIQLTTNDGLEYFSWPYDVVTPTMLILVVKAKITGYRLIGLATDSYKVL